MSLVPSLLQAIVHVDGEALVMHAGDKPYVVSPTGQVDLATRGLALDAINGIVNQLLPVELQNALDEFGAVQYELAARPEFPGESFTVVAARGGDDVWVEVRRRRIPDEDRIPDEFFPPPDEAAKAQPYPVYSSAGSPSLQPSVEALPDALEIGSISHETERFETIDESSSAASSDATLEVPELGHLFPDAELEEKPVAQAAAPAPKLVPPPEPEVAPEPKPAPPIPLIPPPVAAPVSRPERAAPPPPVEIPAPVEAPPPILAKPVPPAPPIVAAAPKPVPVPAYVPPPPAPVAPPPVIPAMVAPPVVAPQPVAPPPVMATPPQVTTAPPPPVMAAPPPPVTIAPPPVTPAPPPVMAAPPPVMPQPSSPVAFPQPAVVLPMARSPIRADHPLPSVGDPTMAGLDRLLRLSAARGASTLYLSSESRASVRVDGEMQMLDGEPVLTSRDVESLLLTLMPERSHEALRTGAATEWILDLEEIGRVRCMSFRDHLGPGGVFRLMPTRSVSMDQLGLPRIVQGLAIEPEGLVLIAGPRSSGKRTLMAAFVDLINRTRRDHVITIEREINIVHERGSSFISQREVRGSDDEMLAAARGALREDPDIIVVEELRTAGLMSVALEAAQSGHLVIGGFSAHTATAAVDRIIDLYGPDERRQVQLALADSLRGVVSQLLLKRNGGGRVAAREVLLNTPAVSSVIAEGKTSQLPMAIEGGRRYGMMPLNDALVGLVQQGIVDGREAYRFASDRPGLLAFLKRQGVDTSFVEKLA